MSSYDMVSREEYNIQVRKSRADRDENKALREKNKKLMNNYRDLIEEIKDYKSMLEKKQEQLDLFWKMYDAQKGQITKLKILLQKDDVVVGCSPIMPNQKTIRKMSKLDERADGIWEPEKGSKLNPF